MPAPTEISAATGIDVAYAELRRLAAAYLRGENRGLALLRVISRDGRVGASSEVSSKLAISEISAGGQSE